MSLLTLNGVNGETGGRLESGLTLDDLVDAALGLPPGPDRSELEHRLKSHRAIKDGDPNDLAVAGWAVVFAADDPDAPAIRDALSDLVALRERQCGRPARVLIGEDGYRTGETKRDFLLRVGAEVTGPADPERFPYYVLLVGAPTAIPFDFQYLLDVQYAVGRLHFDDVDDYRTYAESVVRAEDGGATRSRSVALFGTKHDDDLATQLSLDGLVRPLAPRFEKTAAVEKRFGDAATKDGLRELLRAESRPAVLFTASHGVFLPSGHARQRAEQGALVCQDWPGPKRATEHRPDYHFAGADADAMAGDTTIHGMIAFHFACFGAGTPDQDDFVDLRMREASFGHAPEPFLARLPQRLLAHPEGGALAAVGHVDRQWSHSFRWSPGTPGRTEESRQLGYLESMVKKLLDGHRVGAAMEVVNQRFAEVTVEWSELQDQAVSARSAGREVDTALLSALWMAKNDARNTVLMGDPAARIAVG